MRVKFYAWLLLTFITFAFVHTSTAGGYLVQHHTKWCTAHTMLATIEECKNAKKQLDASAPAVESEELDNAPKGVLVTMGSGSSTPTLKANSTAPVSPSARPMQVKQAPH